MAINLRFTSFANGIASHPLIAARPVLLRQLMPVYRREKA